MEKKKEELKANSLINFIEDIYHRYNLVVCVNQKINKFDSLDDRLNYIANEPHYINTCFLMSKKEYFYLIMGKDINYEITLEDVCNGRANLYFYIKDLQSLTNYKKDIINFIKQMHHD